jgi:hypothetical protein
MAMASVDPMTIKRLGGWKTLSMVERYAHLSPDHKRQTFERLKAQSSWPQIITGDVRQLAATVV